MLTTKEMRFPIDMILVCIRWYATYPSSYRRLEGMMQERGLVVDQPLGGSVFAVAGKVIPPIQARSGRKLAHG